MSGVLRLPGRRIGVAIMVNVYEFGAGWIQVVQRMVLDRLLGLVPIDWAVK